MASEAQITNAEIVELGRARFLVAMLSGGAAGLMFAAMLVMAIQQNYVALLFGFLAGGCATFCLIALKEWLIVALRDLRDENNRNRG
jgi:hypothetical protein